MIQTIDTQEKNDLDRSDESLLSFLKDNLRNEFFEVILKVISSPHILLKAYLLIFLVVSSGLAAYTVVESFINYFEYEVITTTRTIFETPTLFPKVTICNLNPLTTKFAFQFLKEQVNFEDELSNWTFEESSSFTRDSYYKALNIAGNKNFSDEKRQNLGHSLDDMLLSCSYNGEECGSRDFMWVFDPMYGNCYVFNSGWNSTSFG